MTNEQAEQQMKFLPISILAGVFLIAGCSVGDEVGSPPNSVDPNRETSETRPAESTTLATTASSTERPESTLVANTPTTSTSETQLWSEWLPPTNPDAGVGPTIRYGSDGVWRTGHGGEYGRVVEGPVNDAVDAGETVYQRPGIDNKIFVADDGDKELLVGQGNQILILEGVRFDGSSPHVMYQRFEPGGPDNTRATLREYNIETGEDREIAVTGGWESSTSFNHISGQRAAGTWSAEAHTGILEIDLLTGEIDYGVGDCLDEDNPPTCAYYDALTLVGDQVYGFGPVSNENGIVDRFGIYRYDLQTGIEQLVDSWQWDNGAYYAQDMFAFGDSMLVISLGDSLPALVHDIRSGTTWTTTETGLFHPAHLS